MTLYTLHLPEMVQKGENTALNKAVLVPQKFSFGAFVFTFLWFFWNRLWMAGLFVLAAFLAMGALVQMLNIAPPAAFIIQLLFSWLVGLEARSLQEWTYEKRGLKTKASVYAASLEEAEVKAFEGWLNEAPLPASQDWPKGPVYAEAPLPTLFPESRPGIQA
jgi:hypothetical protein